MHSRTTIKRNDILDTAAVLFAERGFQGTNMKLLAEEAQASTSTIYSYFQDKNDLLRQAIERRLTELEAQHVERMAQIEDPVESLLQGIGLLNSAIANDPLLASLLIYNSRVTDVRISSHAERVMQRIDEHSIQVMEQAISGGLIEFDDASSLVQTFRLAFQGWLLNRHRGDTTLSEVQFTRTIKHLLLALIIDE